SKQFDCFDNPDVDKEENESENYKGDEDSFSFDLYEENNNFVNYSNGASAGPAIPRGRRRVSKKRTSTTRNGAR
ncbi:MAG: hypothetical protein IIT98_07550, partial [Kiritimatiellae bacterium]|nr:hypothetical protein [Kiritimatiellia bacterium]